MPPPSPPPGLPPQPAPSPPHVRVHVPGHAFVPSAIMHCVRPPPPHPAPCCILQFFAALVRTWSFYLLLLNASKHLHNRMLSCVVRSPISYVDGSAAPTL